MNQVMLLIVQRYFYASKTLYQEVPMYLIYLSKWY